MGHSVAVLALVILASIPGLTAGDEAKGCEQHFLDQIMEEYTMCIRFLDPEKLLATKYGNIAERCRTVIGNMTFCNQHFKGSLSECVNDVQKYSALLLTSKELAHGHYLCRENGKYIAEFWNNKGGECLKSLKINECNIQRKFHNYHDGSFCKATLSELTCLQNSMQEVKICKDPVKNLLIGALEAGLNVTSCDMFMTMESTTSSQQRLTIPRYMTTLSLLSFIFIRFL